MTQQIERYSACRIISNRIWLGRSLRRAWPGPRCFRLVCVPAVPAAHRLTPADYIRRLRLSRSALRLRDEGCRITDVAFELGFGSVDGYQRAFFRAFGCNPGEYAAKPVPLCLFVPYGVSTGNCERSRKKWKM